MFCNLQFVQAKIDENSIQNFLMARIALPSLLLIALSWSLLDCKVFALATMSTTTKLLFENPRMRITDLRIPPKETGGTARHEYPTLRWQVNEGRHLFLGKEEEVKEKTVSWMNAGNSFLVTNTGETEYRQVCFEFKQPPKHSQEEVQKKLSNALYHTNVGTSLLLENDYCRVWDFYLEPGGGDAGNVHHHVLDYCFVYVAKGRLLGSHADGSLGLFDSTNEDGDVSWFDIPDSAPSDPNYAHGGTNGYEDLPMREYLVELK
jgi:mannose-6-phosphate isomerase-like protein (cupin superfamily)